MNKVIVDASVGVKWVFAEDMSEKAALLFERFKKRKIEIIVPEIFYTELAGVCWVKAKKKLATVQEAIKALDILMNSQFQSYSDRELSDVALENALRFNVSAYDGMYLALAEIYLSPLVTADERLLKACGKRFEFIESLKDFSLK